MEIYLWKRNNRVCKFGYRKIRKQLKIERERESWCTREHTRAERLSDREGAAVDVHRLPPFLHSICRLVRGYHLLNTFQFDILSLVSLYKLHSFPLFYSEIWELTFGISEKEHDELNSDGRFRLKLWKRAICPTLMSFCTGAKLSKNLKIAIKSISEHNIYKI